MLKIKRIYDPWSRDDGKRILVDRLWARGIKKDEAKIDEWLKDIAPSDALRKWYAHDPDKWPAFRQKYRKELKGKKDIVDRLRKDAKKGNVTLLFSAKNEDRNNAVALKEMIERDE
ncbi:MAG TPA: DUF488 domain-containing protein [Nitrospirota bacterium]|nr:DUF488 domain-containing protein [Nitrospirota bacterium]